MSESGYNVRRRYGAFAKCKSCGRLFRQSLHDPGADKDKPKEQRIYTNFDLCPRCRMGYESRVTAQVKYSPHPGQKLVHESPARYKVLAMGVRWGKDRCSVNEFIRRFADMLSEERGPELVPTVHGWLIAPTFPMARQIWRELKYFWPQQWTAHIYEQDKILATVGNGVIEVRSADDPESLVTVGLDMVAMTEAARIANLQDVWENVYSRLQSPGRGPGGKGGVAIINSSPLGMNFFYELYTRGLNKKDYPDWESWNFPTYGSPYSNPYITKEQYEKAKKEMSELRFRQDWMAEFLPGGGQVFMNIDKVCTAEPEDPVPGAVYRAAWDPAKVLDYSAFGIRNEEGRMVFRERWSGVPWVQQLDKVEYYCKFYNHARLTVDKTGIGETLPEAAAQRGLEVEGIHMTNPWKEQAVSNLSLLMEQGLIELLDDDELREELRSYSYQVTKSGKVAYRAASQSLKDDLVSLCLLLYHNFNDVRDVMSPFMGSLLGVSIGKESRSVRVA